MAAALKQLTTFTYMPRIFILTDILNEPDDSQSLIRYLLYSNEFETRGICATTSTWLRNSTHPEEIKKILLAYGKVVKRLNNHVHPDFSFLPAEHYLDMVTSGPVVYGKRAFQQPLSEGAQRILDVLQESEEPLYVPVWGGINTLAQALKHLSETRSPEEGAKQRAKLRVYAISDQDDTGTWIRAKFPDIHYIVSLHGWTEYEQASWLGVGNSTIQGPSPEKVLDPWLDRHIRIGELGAVYPAIMYSMEGDSPSFLWLVQNGLGHRDRIHWGGWGGRYALQQDEADWGAGVDAYHYCNTTDREVVGSDSKLYSDHRASIWRWRDAMQDDFAARMHWTNVDSFAEAAHPPVIDVNGHKGVDPLIIKVKRGETYNLDATDTYDPDNSESVEKLDFIWFLYSDVNRFYFYNEHINMQSLLAPTEPSRLSNNTAGFARFTPGPSIQVTIPMATRNLQTGPPTPDAHVILQVTNASGPYPVRRYKRVVLSYAQEV